ncbi:heavy metal sensor histidine kinase [Roseateles flavus]|uniref:Sensor protein n=1 Tax=Roseateles flavus TaxID=3149041 RepID=A0ABV0GF96_9BURK
MTVQRSALALRQRLSRWLALQTFIGLGLVCTAVYIVTAATLSNRQDDTLNQKSAMVKHLLQEGRMPVGDPRLKHQLNDFLAGHEELALRLLEKTGHSLYASSSSQPMLPPFKKRHFEVVVPDDPRGVAQAELTLSTRADEVLLRQLGITLLAAAIIGTAAVSIGCIWLVRLGLAPLRHLVEQTRHLTASQLDKRLDGSEQPRELQPLIEQFNALLERLNHAYHRMEGFNADVAHELNTPLATLISSCEVALRKSRSADDLREVLASNLEDLHRIAVIVKDMLFLSHADQGSSARRSEVQSLASLANDVVEFHEPAMQEASLRAEVIGDASGMFDAGLLRRALSNLLGNATRYATAGSKVLVNIEQVPSGAVRLVVLNRGPTIEPDHLPRVFDRFYRGDPARAHGDMNHGLGLSIVAAIAQMHGGEPFAESEAGVTRIGIEIPVR